MTLQEAYVRIGQVFSFSVISFFNSLNPSKTTWVEGKINLHFSFIELITLLVPSIAICLILLSLSTLISL